MRFVIRLKDGESMASLCREFGISRKTGYKIFERYEQCGLEASAIAPEGRSGMPISCRSQWRRRLFPPKRKSLTGERVRFGSVYCGVSRMRSKFLPRALFTRFWIVMAW
jgi:hypothetical protein